jgi:hypothetical protein
LGYIQAIGLKKYGGVKYSLFIKIIKIKIKITRNTLAPQKCGFLEKWGLF